LSTALIALATVCGLVLTFACSRNV